MLMMMMICGVTASLLFFLFRVSSLAIIAAVGLLPPEIFLCLLLTNLMLD